MKLIYALLILTAPLLGIEKKVTDFDNKIKPFLEKFCIECHGAKKQKARIRFDLLDGTVKNANEAQLLQDVVDVLNTADMPPEDEKQPEGAELEEFIRSLSKDVAEAAVVFSGGLQGRMRRLNKREYTNIIRDTLGVHLREGDVLDELVGHGFDTASSDLMTSRANLQVYLKNGRNISRRFISLAREKRTAITHKYKQYKKKGGFFYNSVDRIKSLPDGKYTFKVTSWLEEGSGPRMYKLNESPRAVYGTKEKPDVSYFDVYFTDAAGKKVFSTKGFPENRVKKKGQLVLGEVVLHGTVSNSQSKEFFKPWMNYFESKSKTPDELAGQVLKKFATLMYRGERLNIDFYNHLLTLFQNERAAGKDFWGAIVEPMALVLASPNFVYVKTSGSLNHRQLANRVSLLLWGSTSNKLNDKVKNEKSLSSEVHRMLDMAQADNFYRDFHYQWLEIERYNQIAVSNLLHPEFNENLRSALKEENFHFIKELIKSNEPIRKLVDADFIMANSIVADYYGLEGNKTNEFKKIKLPKGSPYGGVLTSAAVMTATTTGVRTSPVERGAFILRKFLDDPPLPAPANVPQLESTIAKGLTAKEVLTNHRSTPQCAACHRKMDSLGYTLEGFNIIGLPRSIETRLDDKGTADQVKIDSTGEFMGQTLTGVKDLKSFLIQNESKLARSYIKALLSYSLGRKMGFSDKAQIDSLVKQNALTGFKMKNIIVSVLNSSLFKKK